MAIIFEAWQADGQGQSRLDYIRSDRQDWWQASQGWLAHWKAQPACVLITKRRTDHQSIWEHILWQRPGYKDPVT